MAMRKDKITGLVGTAILHIAMLLILFFVFIHRPEVQAEGGVPVVLGEIDIASGDADPAMSTRVDRVETGMPQAEAVSVEPEPPSKADADKLIVQEEEKTVEMPASKNDKNTAKTKPKKETAKPAENHRTPTVKHDQQSEVEKKADAERIAAEKKGAAEKAAAAQAAQSVAGAFGKGMKMGSRGTGERGEGIQGSPTGNSDTGKSSGIGGYGAFDLNGRSLGPGGLPVPVYNVQDEGRVVVTITVDPDGRVSRTSINKRTNTVNEKLREAAMNAAKKARFNRIDGVNDQIGTITYYFKLK